MNALRENLKRAAVEFRSVKIVDEAVLSAAPENELIRNTMKKADLLLNSYKKPYFTNQECML